MIKLLLVEDDKNLSYIVQSGLQDIIGGYEVITACNGEEGLEAWKAHRPDIIISDIDMPVMDGFEMVRRIRATDEDTPILFASALTSPKDVRKGYDIGVNNYVKKPFIPDELDAHLHAILKMKEVRPATKKDCASSAIIRWMPNMPHSIITNRAIKRILP